MKTALCLLALTLALTAVTAAPHAPVHHALNKFHHTHDLMAADLARAASFAAALETDTSSSSLPYSNRYVGGNIFPIGIYYTTVNVGTPGVPFDVAIDTGSADLIIPSYGCNGCYKTPSFYNAANSTSSHAKMCGGHQCSFNNEYETCNLTDPTQPCTVSGPVWTDVFALGGDISAPVDFGAITFQSKNFQQFFVIDGVWGLAYEAVSGLGVTPPFQVLVEAGKVNDVFSMCLENNTGVLTIGGIDTSLTTGPIGYTDLSCESYYCINIPTVSVGGVSTTSLGSTIVDSGTNNVLFPAKNWNAIKDAFLNNCSNSNLPGVCGSGPTLFDGACFNLTAEEVAMFPPISFELAGGTTVTMMGEDYLLKNSFQDPAGGLCWGIGNTGSGFEALTIVGDALMQSYYVVFDRANSRMGWAPVNYGACVSAANAL